VNHVQSKLRNLAIVLLVILCGLQIGLWFSATGMRHLRSLEISVEDQQSENEQQALKNEQLEAEVLDLREGLDAVEERARSELGLIGEDETFYQIIEKDSQEDSQDNTPDD